LHENETFSPEDNSKFRGFWSNFNQIKQMSKFCLKNSQLIDSETGIKLRISRIFFVFDQKKIKIFEISRGKNEIAEN